MYRTLRSPRSSGTVSSPGSSSEMPNSSSRDRVKSGSRLKGSSVSLCCAKSTDPASSKIVPVRNMWILRFINFVTKKRNDGFIQSEHGTQLYFPVLKIDRKSTRLNSSHV